MNYFPTERPSRVARRLVLFLVLAVALSLTLHPAEAFAWFHYQLDDPITFLRSNSAVDIIYDGEYVWLATPNGISGTTDNGTTWITYDSTNGLNADDVSAIASSEGRLYVATARNIIVDGAQIPRGEGFNISSDLGATWDSYTPRQATFSSMLAFDIAPVDSIVWASCFAGALIRSLDYGKTWNNVFPSYQDSIDFVREDNNGFRRYENFPKKIFQPQVFYSFMKRKPYLIFKP